MKSNNKLNDIPEEQLQIAEITSQYGYEIYQKAKEKFPEDSDEDFNKIMNSLESSLIYFMGNEVNPKHLDSLCDSICQSLKNNIKRIKRHKDNESSEYLFSKELRDRMSKFGNMGVRDAVQDPNFLNELMIHAGMDLNGVKDMWEKIGRSDIAEQFEYEDDKDSNS